MDDYSEFKITTIYYYVQNSYRNDNGIFNYYSLTSDYSKASNFMKCRVAYIDELEAMSCTSNGLIFSKGLICVNEGYYIWDSTNRMYFKIDVNTGVI